MKEREVLSILEKRYKQPEYAFFPHVRNGTGFVDQLRTADAVVMSLWPSRGLDLYGFEVKVSRADWLRELRSPEKGEESILRYMDRWWIVVPDSHPPIVQPEELPTKWGLQIIKNGKTKISVHAPLLPSKALPKQVLAAILRKAKEQWDKPQKPIIDEKAYQRGLEQGTTKGKDILDSANSRNRVLEGRIAEFQRASGVNIDQWNAGDIGKAVCDVLREDYWDILKGLHQRIQQLTEGMGRTLEARPLNMEIKPLKKLER